MNPDDPRHGTDNGYINLGCRCDKCKAAKAARNARERQVRHATTRSEGVPAGVQHNASTYSNWGCRCQACTQEWAKYILAQYHARRAAQADQ